MTIATCVGHPRVEVEDQAGTVADATRADALASGRAVDGDRQSGGRSGADPEAAARARARRAARPGSRCTSPPSRARRRSSRVPRPTTVTTSSRAAATGSSPRSRASRPTPAAGSRSCRPARATTSPACSATTRSSRCARSTRSTHGHDRVVDLGRVNGRWYTCVTASGFDAEANRWANTVRRLSGTTLYVAAVLRTLAVYKPHRFRLTVDGEAHETTRLARRGRQRSRVRGRHARHARRRASTTACSTSPIVGAMSRPEFLWNFPKVFKGTPRRPPEGHDPARRATCSSSRSTRRSRWRSTPTANASGRCRGRWKPCATR